MNPPSARTCTCPATTPASGWAFYLLPGSAVLELRGGSVVPCGALPGGEAGEDAREELTGFLRFLHADTLRTEHPLTPARLAACRAADAVGSCQKGRTLPLPPAPPAELVPDKAPSMLPVSRLVFAESDAEADEFYPRPARRWPMGGHLPRAVAQRQTRLHGGLLRAEAIPRAAMAAGVTDPAWQGRGWRGI